MEMSSQPRDRLGELSDPLIFKIFEFLPMNDIVRTQILSHRWEKLWTVTPHLRFINVFENMSDFRSFVNRCLLLWRGKTIQKFKIWSDAFDRSLYIDIDLWVRFAVDNGVEELDLCLNEYTDYRVPKFLYSCSSLKKLSICGSISAIDGNGVQWNQLKVLNIVQRFRITQDAIDLVLSKCPVLEVFKLSFIDNNDNLKLSIRSSSLKILVVYKIDTLPADISMDTELRICTPNLETLGIVGKTYGTCLLMDVSSLTHAALCLSENDHVGVTLSQILPTIRHVKGLTLSTCYTKVLGIMMSNNLLSPFPCVMFLKLSGSFTEHEQILGILESFPKLKTLVVNDEELKHVDPNSKKNFNLNHPSESFLAELKTLEVTWNMHDFSIFPFIEILLRYSSKLEKMVFRAKAIVPPSGSSDSLHFESQTKILGMQRSSPTLEFIF